MSAKQKPQIYYGIVLTSVFWTLRMCTPLRGYDVSLRRMSCNPSVSFPPFVALFVSRQERKQPLRGGSTTFHLPVFFFPLCYRVLFLANLKYTIPSYYAFPNVFGTNKDFYERLDAFIITSFEHIVRKSIIFAYNF